MPVDLYQWEVNGGLVHHCPKCFKPLTTPQARSRCLGEHVEWCKRYHTQLFKKGTSGQCAPCRNGDEQHQRRHREIAELVHKLALLNTPANPTIPMNFAGNAQDPDNDATPKTKKERKAAKKAKKIAEMPKTITVATIDHVGKVLHPNDFDDDEELELKLLKDPDIADNRFFHKGTSNIRDVRNQFIVKKSRGGDKVEFRVEAKEMDGLLQLLNVSPATGVEEKKLVEELKTKIEADLVQEHKENEEFLMRKGGFWRWASKKAYNRLVANGKLWEDKGDEVMGVKSEGEECGSEGDAVFSTHSGDATDDTEVTEPDTGDVVKEVKEAVETLALSTPKTPEKAAAADDDGWTAVSSKTKRSSKGKKETPKVTIKLAANNGLAKLVQSSTPRKTDFLRHCGEDD